MAEYFPEVVGRAIRQHREALRLKQSELGDMMGYTPQGTISNWELGRALPNAYNLCSLADVFGCTVDELLGRTSEIERTV